MLSVGADDLNLRLSENRANSVRDFLIGQAGSRNRRGELVVSGEVIGASIDGAVEANAQLLSAFRAQSLGKHGHDVQLHAGA